MVVLHVVVVRLGLRHHFDVVGFGRVRVQLLQLCLGQVVHDARTVGVTHHIHRSPESITEQRERIIKVGVLLIRSALLWFGCGTQRTVHLVTIL